MLIQVDRSVQARVVALVAALTDPECENLICVRGGFGTSDLLPYIPYEDLAVHKRVVGYSDISALLSALWTKNRFVGISGPMPWAVTWRIHTEEMRILLGVMSGDITTGNLPVKLQPRKNIPHIDKASIGVTGIEGTLYGGDISVLTNLIGTPYMPESLDGYILFFEGLYENTYRVIRYLNQWQQSACLMACGLLCWVGLTSLTVACQIFTLKLLLGLVVLFTPLRLLGIYVLFILYR